MNATPAPDYPLLLKQFHSCMSLITTQEEIISFYHKKDYSLSEKRLEELELALHSEKQMNHQLSAELTHLELQYTKLANAKNNP